MTNAPPQSLNFFTLPLFGERLIEASAGTGKTYTLAALYLRLLLGLGKEAAYLRPLSVDEILVVTFTEAATEELRERIRERIHELRLACIRRQSDNPLMTQLLAEIPEASRADAAETLLMAERQMDDAAIYTIHGFCQRMLTSNAFESGVLFEQRLLEDEQPLRRQACADFWRRYCYPLPLDMARVIGTLWSGPEKLLQELTPYLHGDTPALRLPPQESETLVERHQKIIATIDGFKQQWREAAPELDALISASGVDKRRYSSRNRPNWLRNVTQWAEEQPTVDYQFPKDLERFGQSELNQRTIKGEPPSHAVFDAVDQFLQQSLSLRDLMIWLALKEIRRSVREEKQRRAELGFDDLLSRLDEALQQAGGEQLAQAIRERYPVAMIDEFQDTDTQQYRIFRTLYAGQSQCGWLMIGDPKQAIYAFRGADIFTYMRARDDVTAHYTLDTNWRSSPDMVNAVNCLFQRVDAPFIFSQIPFMAVKPAESNRSLSFEYQGAVSPALQFWLTGTQGVGVSEYQQIVARQCASQIRDWLMAGQRHEAWLVNGDKRQPVQAADITVLVRSRHEATLVRQALGRLNIPSVYLSNRDSVFTTPEARDVLWLLHAVLAPEQERTLRSAMATTLMGLDAPALEALNHNEADWDALVDEFAGYRLLWQQRGVLPMLRALMRRHQLAENLLSSRDGERRLTDILHVGELLQEASSSLDSEHALVRWLSQQIMQPNPQAENQQLRLESDQHLVQIVTIHKSKGLEYPLVWLPFIGNFRQQSQGLYHDRESFQALLDLQNSEESQTLAEEERLAEDLRLLYVAMTRAIYHCSIGVAPLYQRSQKKEGDSDMHQSALGYLLQRGVPADAAGLIAELDGMAVDGVTTCLVNPEDEQPWQPLIEDQQELQARQNTRVLRDGWRVTSYSGLQQHGSSVVQDLLPRLDIEAMGERQQEPESQLTPHTFPRGASPGTFLHGLFESLDFTQPVDDDWLMTQLQAYGIDEIWCSVLRQWMETILTTPLNKDGIQLAELDNGHKQAEMQFYLPIQQAMQARNLDSLTKTFDPLSAQCPPLAFQQVKGMLKGFIDLVFCWQGRYYLLDYKSNWLGADASAYTQSAMMQAMAEHRYDLQYQLYTLALHRYLRHRLPEYDYQQHFGGVFYLFLRGIDVAYPGNGVFFCCPPQGLVEGMDQLFQGKGSEGEQRAGHD
ncbi:exodeoxyribonuclease V subunit beta [Brenneria uluponensis]|uniref:exodeoxyribonuclease V subunit beta n=1 Tax=Brenneria uluponensis TaxID=3057057 RepID=UPI0028E608B4|nr:exodeoxyribonuclease V subunit beta [Brenneria ulupoensis]